MLNIKTSNSKMLLRFFSAILLTGLGLYGCGSNSSSTLDVATAAAVAPVAAIPVSVSVDPASLPIPIPAIPPTIAAGISIQPTSGGQATITLPAGSSVPATGSIVTIGNATTASGNYNGSFTVVASAPTNQSFTVAAPNVGSLSASATPTVQQQILATPVTGIAPSTTSSQATIAASNTLTNGAPITISGSSIPALNGPNIAINPTSTSVTIATTYVPPPLPPAGTNPTPLPAGTNLGVILTGGGVLPATQCTTATTGTAGAITLPKSALDMDSVPSRFTGIAPLAVFFDATSTTATATTRPFHDIEYRWNFGDDDTLTWANGAHVGDGSVLTKKNRATGPVAAHVFETPGTYIVNLTVTDGTNTVSNNCIQIAVANPDQVFSGSNTICVAATSLPVAGVDGCPSGALTDKQSTFTTIITNVSNGTYPKRVLLKHDDTFTVGTNVNLAVAGPGMIAGYGCSGCSISGAGARPTIQASADNVILLQPSSASTPNATSNLKDWRFMDLQLTGGNGTFATVDGIFPAGGMDQVTVLRVNTSYTYSGVRLNTPTLDYANSHGHPGHTLFDQWAVVDCTTNNITNVNAGLSIYASANRFMLLGNSFNNNGGGEHTARLPKIGKGVVSDNTFQGEAPAKSAFTLRASVIGNTGVEGATGTQYVVVSDNRFVGATGSSYTVYYGPQNAVNELVSDVVTERNVFLAGGTPAIGTQVGLAIVGHEQTIRNNLFDTSGGQNHLGISIFDLTVVSDQIRVYNNTMYSASTGTDFIGVEVHVNDITNVTVANNLGYAPLDTQHYMVACVSNPILTACPTLATTHNSSYTDVRSTNPNFSVTPPIATSDWRPTTGYAIGGGTSVPVWSDFFLKSLGTTRDMGAVCSAATCP